MPDLPQSLVSLIAALAAGLLVGMERGWVQRELPSGRRAAGFRTFGIIGLVGGMAAMVPDGLAAAVGFGLVVVLAIGYARGATEQQLSATTTIAALLTFLAGFAATRVSPTIGLAAAAATFAILSSRPWMHALLKGLGEAEIEGVARFVLVALVILPLLPDADYGPYAAWNPRRIWMVVVLVMGLSFAGFVAARRFGSDRGILIVALTGAIVSSTAVTLDYARRLRAEPEARGALTAGIALASMVMFVRVQLLAAVLVPRVVPALVLVMAPAMVVAAIFGLVAWRRQAKSSAAIALGNPFAFAPALLLAGLVAVLSLAARWSLERFGSSGMAVVLGLTGMADVDAAVITLAGLPDGILDDWTGGIVLAVPVLANTAVKAVMTMLIGSGHGGLRAALPLLGALLASAGAMAAWYLS